MKLQYAPLTPADLPELEAVLRNDAVYAHIGGTPSPERFHLGMSRALQGPPASRPTERWINYMVRDESGAALGRLEATVHDGIAEVAFLYGPETWGMGYASHGLQWLHQELRRIHPEVKFLWATTRPENTRSANLLVRNGYARADPNARPSLYSYDDGDLVFTLACG